MVKKLLLKRFGRNKYFVEGKRFLNRNRSVKDISSAPIFKFVRRHKITLKKSLKFNGVK